MLNTDFGSFVIAGRLNYIREFEVKDFPGGQADFDGAGYTNNDPNRRLTQSMPDLKGSLGVTFMRDRHTARLSMRYVGSYEDNGSANNIIGDADINSYQAVGFSYNYVMPIGDSSLTWTLGVIDLFDEDLPKLKIRIVLELVLARYPDIGATTCAVSGACPLSIIFRDKALSGGVHLSYSSILMVSARIKTPSPRSCLRACLNASKSPAIACQLK